MIKYYRPSIIVLICQLILLSSINNAVAEEENIEREADQILRAIEKDYSTENWENVYREAKILLHKANREEKPFYAGKSYYYLGSYYSNKQITDSSIFYFRSAKKAYMSCRDTLNIGIVSCRVGLEYQKNNDTENAILNFQKSSDLLEMVRDTVWFGFARNRLGSIYFSQGNYILALKNFQQSINAFEMSNHLLNLGITYNKMGLIYRKIEDKQKEQNAYLRAIAYLKQMDPSKQLGEAYNNLAEVYLDKGEVNKGLEYLEKAKVAFENLGHTLGLCSYYNVLSYYNLNIVQPPNYEKVIEYCDKSLNIAEENEYYQQYADVTYFLGQAYLAKNQMNKAEQILLDGLNVADSHGYKHEVLKITEILAEVYEKLGQLKLAYTTLREYNILKDSIVGEEKIKGFTQLDMQYRFSRQQMRDSLKYEHNILEKDFLHRKEIQSQKQSMLILIFISLLFIITAFFVYVNARKNKKQVQILSEKNALINLQKMEIEAYSSEIQEAYIKLQELDEYKQAMSNMLVHDLKNPLNLLANHEVFEDEQEMRMVVNRTSKQMLNMVTNLLDISKAEHNNMQLNKKKVYLIEVLNEAIGEVDYLCIQKHIKIVKKSFTEYSLQADKDLLLRIFTNILTNAIKFGPVGSEVCFDAVITQEKQLKIFFKDKGPGIAKEHHEVIFEKFKQVGDNKIGSTGLGLAFCKMACELHNWSIRVNSDPEKGAEFWITIDEYKTIVKA